MVKMKIKYKNNEYRYRNGVWYIIGGTNGFYLSRVTCGEVIIELNKLLGE